jgi:hypothetical protein
MAKVVHIRLRFGRHNSSTAVFATDLSSREGKTMMRLPLATQVVRETTHEEKPMSQHQPTTAEEEANATAIRALYASAEAAAKDTAKFVSYFAEGGYFYDVGAGKKYYGKEIGGTVDIYAAAFPDMHRELYGFYFNDDVVVVELSLNGTHNGDLELPAGVIPPTHKEIHAPCCDVFHLKDGKVASFHCYVAVPILLEQLGVFGNLSAALKKK